ncbi:MAG: ribosome small subunit-dependent GTPase A [Myxococcota bacterium]|jgi:ribosome biogenesis GTPase|nr:ribosome small subunit-dependent GTPase A [Myxococcota bacterium]
MPTKAKRRRPLSESTSAQAAPHASSSGAPSETLAPRQAAAQPCSDEALLGTLIRIEGPEFVVAIDGSEDVFNCVLAGRRLKGGTPVVGDRVRLLRAQPRPVLTQLLPRQSSFERLSVGQRRTQALVANIDTVVITVSCANPPLRPGLIDRYLLAASQRGLFPILLFNKWDLASEFELEHASLYNQLGYLVLCASAQDGFGIEDLMRVLAHRRSVFVGHSGVGKSSLLNRIAPDAGLTVGELSHGRGAHTTSQARLCRVGSSGFVIDTPGVREFGVTGVPSSELWCHFPEFAARAEACRFRPCMHIQEPDCAVHAAVNEGLIHEQRFASYLRLYSELKQEEEQRFR